LTITVSQRSLVDPSLDAIITQCEAVAHLAGAECFHVGKTYGWKPDRDSQLLAICRNAYLRIFGEAPRISGIHAMLECGLIKAKYPHMQMISIGPNIWDAHTPTKADYVLGADSGSIGERIDTVRMPLFWDFVKTILKQLAQLKA
jgi:di/tripeptidase